MLSIIINTHDRINELEKCLRKISEQTFQDYEIFVIDQNSNLPGIEEIVKKFSKTIYLKLKKNLGPAVGRNIAVKNGRKIGSKKINSNLTSRYIQYIY